MPRTPVHTLDLRFQGRPHSIASYLVPHSGGAVLVECGPGSTLEGLKAGLAAHGLGPVDVTHVLITHIHLDHAGAAGWLARQGARIVVHPAGAPHLLNPEKLLASARRIYGDRLDALFGEFLPVPAESLGAVEDGEEIASGGLRFVALDTPGHAGHHHVYLFEDICFTGDIGGVRVPGPPFLRIPTPPPEIDLERWRESVQRLRREKIARVAPTHFGIFDDAQWHLAAIERAIEATEAWLAREMPRGPSLETMREDLAAWLTDQARAAGLDHETLATHEITNPLGMSADGLERYWRKRTS